MYGNGFSLFRISEPYARIGQKNPESRIVQFRAGYLRRVDFYFGHLVEREPGKQILTRTKSKGEFESGCTSGRRPCRRIRSRPVDINSPYKARRANHPKSRTYQHSEHDARWATQNGRNSAAEELPQQQTCRGEKGTQSVTCPKSYEFFDFDCSWILASAFGT